MDPTAALRELLDAFDGLASKPDTDNRQEVIDRLTDLRSWIVRQGFAPNVPDAIEAYQT